MSRLCAALAGIVACCVLMSHSGWAAGDIQGPIEVVGMSVDTVGLTTNSTVSISVLCWPKQFTNVTARIVPDSGFEIISQPKEIVAKPKDDETMVFRGVIRATSRGIWRVKVEGVGTWSGKKEVTGDNIFYIQVSDSLNRWLTATEEAALPHGKVFLRKGSKPDSVIYTPGLKTPKPAVRDSLNKHRTGRGKRSGSFNLIGSIYYHDPRDPSGWTRPAVSVSVEVWNDNEYDNPSSSDELLGTTVTDSWGCFSLWGLDNYDEDGTADPYLIWRTQNDSWTVTRPIPGTIYQWYSSMIIRDVRDDFTVDFGDDFFDDNTADVQAMWCFQYINLGWNTAQSVGPYPDPVWCYYPSDSAYFTGGNIYISWTYADAIDVVNHEYAHALMYQGQGYAHHLPHACSGSGHQILNSSCDCLAWTEGWADFFPLVVTPDGKIDYTPVGSGFPNHVELENNTDPGFQQGPAVEGRVAAALLDLWDTNNDNLDQNSGNPVSFETLYTWGLQYQRDSTFWEFWSYLRNNELNTQQIALGLQSIKNNTIDFGCTSCGNANSDGTINIADAVFLIAYIFAGGTPPGDCNYPNGMGDASGDVKINIGDAVFLIAYIFAGGATPHCQ